VASKRGELVPRPPKKMEYEIRFATTNTLKSIAKTARWIDIRQAGAEPRSNLWCTK